MAAVRECVCVCVSQKKIKGPTMANKVSLVTFFSKSSKHSAASMTRPGRSFSSGTLSADGSEQTSHMSV